MSHVGFKFGFSEHGSGADQAAKRLKTETSGEEESKAGARFGLVQVYLPMAPKDMALIPTETMLIQASTPFEMHRKTPRAVMADLSGPGYLEKGTFKPYGPSKSALTETALRQISHTGLSQLASDAGSTDLVSGVYEGGLKTWEGTFDLLFYIRQLEVEHKLDLKADKCIDLGCGGGLVGIYLLFNDACHVDFLDYNYQVLLCLTLPNIIANLYAATYPRPQGSPSPPEPDQSSDEPSSGEESVDEDTHEGAEEDKYRALFGQVETKTRLLAGDWSDLAGEAYDLIVSSETLYSMESCKQIYQVIKKNLSKTGRALIASKTNYFGVGGSLVDFQRIVDEDAVFESRIVFETKTSVPRSILELTYPSQT